MTAVSGRKAIGIGITDAFALLLIFAVPALSHLTAVPFYLLDPMRIAVLGALLCTGSTKNSLALSIALPLMSLVLSGHPVFPKCALIAVELAANVLLFAWLAKKMNAGIAVFISIIASKVLYYALKAAVLSAGLLEMGLVSTSLWIQLVVALVFAAAFALFGNRRQA